MQMVRWPILISFLNSLCSITWLLLELGIGAVGSSGAFSFLKGLIIAQLIIKRNRSLIGVPPHSHQAKKTL